MLNIEKYKKELLEEFEKGNHFEQCIHEVRFRHGAFQLTPRVNVIYVGDLLDWLTSEYKEPILTDEEKEYLSNVIKPFKDKVKGVIKYVAYEKRVEFISIEYKDEDGKNKPILLPKFKGGTMYKGMKDEKKYTLEELGL